MEKRTTQRSLLLEEFQAIATETDPIEKFERIKTFFERHPARLPKEIRKSSRRHIVAS